jgi:hypothetical protein
MLAALVQVKYRCNLGQCVSSGIPGMKKGAGNTDLSLSGKAESFVTAPAQPLENGHRQMPNRADRLKPSAKSRTR